jgi:hypothetical protein
MPCPQLTRRTLFESAFGCEPTAAAARRFVAAGASTRRQAATKVDPAVVLVMAVKSAEQRGARGAARLARGAPIAAGLPRTAASEDVRYSNGVNERSAERDWLGSRIPQAAVQGRGRTRQVQDYPRVPPRTRLDAAAPPKSTRIGGNQRSRAAQLPPYTRRPLPDSKRRLRLAVTTSASGSGHVAAADAGCLVGIRRLNGSAIRAMMAITDSDERNPSKRAVAFS